LDLWHLSYLQLYY